MTNDHLNNAAKDLLTTLQKRVKFYLTVGWLKEEKLGVLVVYYDTRELLPHGLVPNQWRGYEVRVQDIIPPGASRPADPPYAWVIV